MSRASGTGLPVRILLFARYAELLGRETVELPLSEPSSVGEIVARLRELPGGAELPPRPLCALNLRQVAADAAVSPGDELALLPPMAGG